MQKIPNLYDLIDMNSPDAIMAEVQGIATAINPQITFEPVNSAYRDILRLFAGCLPGYQGCKTAYHDIFHTMDVLLASLRLVHGVAMTGIDFSAREISQIILAALMHDTGYILQQNESSGTGAQFTAIHVDRSIAFISSYFLNPHNTSVDLEAMTQMVRCTGLDMRIDGIAFISEKTRLLGFILGTADLLGQMSDRYYVEKLPTLYEEFQEGGIPGFSSDFDLVQKTPGFYAMAADRFINTLGGVNRFMKSHFLARWNIDGDLYAVSMERNLVFLKSIENSQDCKTKAKRKRLLKAYPEVWENISSDQN
jgi:hypothetical protein